MAIYQYCEWFKSRSIVVWPFFCACLLIGVGTGCNSRNPLFGTNSTSIIPKPQSLVVSKGTFAFSEKTVINSDQGGNKVAVWLSEKLRVSSGFSLRVGTESSQENKIISLMLDANLENLGSEGYTLQVTPNQITIRANREAGLFYGCQSLLQLLPPEIFSKNKVGNIQWIVPCLTINDSPRFVWRGGHLDVSRHFLSVEFIKKYIDLLAMHKMNVFHWHLTDDQGWRVEIKKYPKLTTIGAWRTETVVGDYIAVTGGHPVFDGTPHGGFYTQDQIREIVAYAKDRYIEIVPEIDVPGHSQAAIAAYPELGNLNEKLPVRTTWGINKNILNAEESTIRFYEDVLSEIVDLFPSKYIHIGGDEVVKDQWKESWSTQKRINELCLKDEESLQDYFVCQMAKFLASKDRVAIGWDYIFKNCDVNGTVAMAWTGVNTDFIEKENDVILTPAEFTYLDYAQSEDELSADMKKAGALAVTLKKAYSYNPVPKGLSAGNAKHILGTEGLLWTEYMPDQKRVEFMMFPRMAALSEVMWTEVHEKNFNDFRNRLDIHLKRLKMLDVNYRKLDEEKK